MWARQGQPGEAIPSHRELQEDRPEPASESDRRTALRFLKKNLKNATVQKCTRSVSPESGGGVRGSWRIPPRRISFKSIPLKRIPPAPFSLGRERGGRLR